MDQPNAVLKSHYEGVMSQSARSSISTNSQLPFPYMAAMFDDVKRDQKRVLFPPKSPDDTKNWLKDIEDQIISKNLRKVKENESSKQFATEEIANWKRLVAEDRLSTTNEELLKQLEFLQYNDMIVKRHV